MNRKLSHRLKEYFTFSSGEKTGIIILLFLMLVILIVKISIPYYFNKKYAKDFEKLATKTVFTDTVSSNSRPFEVNLDTLKRSEIFKPNRKTFVKKKDLLIIELNAADSTELMKLPGIGPVLSKRIIKYREMLGGFYTTKQIAEVYGVKPEVFEKIKKFLRTDTSFLKKINTNEATFKEINAHPYISFEQTKAIMNLRVKTKLSMVQIRNSGIFSPDEFEKVRNYLIF